MITRRHLLGTIATALIATPALARPARLYVKQGFAVSGFDPVAYFDQSQPVEGQDSYRLHWHNAVWQFASAQNMASFERDPHAYAPQYGGYCAMALAQGKLTPSIPEAWAIHDGKLYLTHSTQARDQWLQNPDGRIAEANVNWSSLLSG